MLEHLSRAVRRRWYAVHAPADPPNWYAVDTSQIIKAPPPQPLHVPGSLGKAGRLYVEGKMEPTEDALLAALRVQRNQKNLAEDIIDDARALVVGTNHWRQNNQQYANAHMEARYFLWRWFYADQMLAAEKSPAQR